MSTVLLNRHHANQVSNLTLLPDNEIEKEKVFQTENVNLWYGEHQALHHINLSIRKKEVMAIIGPSGCGKSTYLKTLNRMVELVPNVRTTGKILYHGKSIFDKNFPAELLRTQVGMVFQK